MKKILLLLLIISFASTSIFSQKITLQKGIVIDNIKVADSTAEGFSLYLPTNFDLTKKWPVLFVFDMEGKSRQAMRMFVSTAEEEGYILAASNNVNDSLSTAKNILITSRMLSSAAKLLPLNLNRLNITGANAAGKFVAVAPNFIKGISGVISFGASIPNFEILSKRNQFYYVGVVGQEDYNFPQMRTARTALNKLGFPNRLIVYEGGKKWPELKYIADAVKTLTIAAIGKGYVVKDDNLITTSYNTHLAEFMRLKGANKLLQADHLIGEMMKMYRPLFSVDSLKQKKKILRKEKLYKAQNRSRNAAFFKENLIKDDYVYYLEEDLLTYNYNNLGWWNYQMQELKKYESGADMYQKSMGVRLKGFVNDLISDYIDVYKAEKLKDEEGLNLLWMLKTITAPKEYANYLNIISNSARIEDYSTTLFYVEELLKNGYTNRQELYDLEHTAIIRISPEFNEIVAKYLEDARYEVIPE